MKSIELFAGAGGLGIGLHEAGFRPVRVIERDPYCCDTLRENMARKLAVVRHWPLTQADVREIDFKGYEGNVTLVSGGPPCQPFSVGGKHGAHDDARDMFPQAVRVVREVRPCAFIFENVKGLTRATFRDYFRYIRLRLEHPDIEVKPGEDWADHLARLERHHVGGRRSGLNYRVVTQVLNAADYGVPQRRERVFFVGFREDLGIDWRFPPPTHSREALLRDIARGDYWERNKVSHKDRRAPADVTKRGGADGLLSELMPWRTVREALADLPDPELWPELSERYANHRFQPGARSYPGHTGSPLDEPAKTLKAGVHGVPGGENMVVKPTGEVRYFTVRESARLQTFPDDFLFHGSWSETMRQLGNAVPARLATIIGDNVAACLKAA